MPDWDEQPWYAAVYKDYDHYDYDFHHEKWHNDHRSAHHDHIKFSGFGALLLRQDYDHDQ